MGTQGGKEASSLNSCPLRRDPQGGDPVVSWGSWDTPRVSPGIVGIIIICNQNIIIFHGREIQDDMLLIQLFGELLVASLNTNGIYLLSTIQVGASRRITCCQLIHLEPLSVFHLCGAPPVSQLDRWPGLNSVQRSTFQVGPCQRTFHQYGTSNSLDTCSP